MEGGKKKKEKKKRKELLQQNFTACTREREKERKRDRKTRVQARFCNASPSSLAPILSEQCVRYLWGTPEEVILTNWSVVGGQDVDREAGPGYVVN